MTILEAFAELPDPRREHPNKLHKLLDIIVIALCAVISKCESWEEIADYGLEKEQFLRSFLDLPNGIPSHDTFNRVFARLSPEAWQSCFMNWMHSVSTHNESKLISLDGKVLRGTRASGNGKREVKQTALALVSAWASENELVLGQLAFDKGHEPQAIFDLLGLLDLEGASVSIDAAGCYPETAQLIVDKEADYLLSLKANQGKLFEDASWLFEQHVDELDSFESFDVAHGREETRTCWVMDELDYLERHEWPQLKRLIVVDAKVLRKGKERYQRRFFLSSEVFTAEAALTRVRAHWSIENQQHYPLDVIWREDNCRTRAGFAAQNLAVLRRFALNLLNLDESKLTRRRKRLKALLDDSYLPKLLGLERNA